MIFVDESIQHELGYVCVGFAYCENSPDEAVNRAIARAGLVPSLDEYKSGARMANAEAMRELRDSIYHIVLGHCRLGLYVGSIDERPNLLVPVVATAKRLIQRNALPRPQHVFVDEGIAGAAEIGDGINLSINCDSRHVPGIQLADFVAYHCSYLLKCSLTGEQKTIRLGSEAHPPGGQEAELDWLIRTALRRHFFVESRGVDEMQVDDWNFKLAGYGAFISDWLRPEVKAAAEATFDSMYFGCVW